MANIDKDKVWAEVLSSLKVQVSSAIYTTWLAQTHLSSLKKLDKNRYLAEIGCNSPYVKTTIEARYFGLVQDALIKTINTPTDLTFTVRQKTRATQFKPTAQTPLFEDKEPSGDMFYQRIARANLRIGFTFDNFAVSSSNQMAYAASEAVAENPANAYNPLFIWGGVGVGKTHLMHSVGHKMIHRNIEANVLACTGEDFTNDIVEGIRNKTTQKFRDKYRKLALLLVDDVQFIAGKDTVQEEFFHTFNAVTASGGQIILTSDQPPAAIPKLEERLKSRFEAGLLVDVAPPDFELRCAIVQIKAKEKKVLLEPRYVNLIAGNIEGARRIEGVLTRLASETKLRGVEVSEEIITNIIGKGIDDENALKKVSPSAVIEAVCTYYQIGKRGILGDTRAKVVSHPRHVLMYLMRNELNLPYEEIGKLIGGRDHSTVMHGVDKMTRLASSDIHIREDIMRIKKALL